MRLTITTFSNPLDHGDWPSVWAFCVEVGQSTVDALADGVLASGPDDRTASNAALIAYWKREDERAQAASAVEKADALFQSTLPIQTDHLPLRHPADASYARATTLSARVAVSQPDIKRMLADAIHERASVLMHYIDAQGSPTTRIVKPSQIEARGFMQVDYLTAYDPGKQEPRTFLIERISRVESV